MNGPEAGFPHKDPGILFRRLEIDDLDPKILSQALVHSSFAHERGTLGERWSHSGRLEFLGDAVLDLVVSEYLYRDSPELSEGQMTRLRSSLVAGPALAARARAQELDQYLFVSRGDDTGDGRNRESILAEALEALVAAVFLDGGWVRARELVMKILDCGAAPGEADHKSRLQELTQAHGLGLPSYQVTGRRGPDHNPTFEVEVLVDGVVWGRGSGSSKKWAENEAARQALLSESHCPGEF